MSATHSLSERPGWLRVPRRSARFRLTAIYGGLFILTAVALVAITFVLFQRATEYRTPAIPKVPHTPAAIRNFQFPADLPFLLPAPANKNIPTQFYTAQQNLSQTRRQLILMPAEPPKKTVGSQSLQGQLQFTRTQELDRYQTQLARDQHQLSQSVRQLAQSVRQLAQAGVVQAAQRAVDSHQLLVNSGIALAIVAVLALLAGWLVAGRMLRPIRTITRKARRISSASLHERLALDGPQDELKELGDTLDGLFARLEAAFDAQRHFVANASHELRTPLTAERTLLQVALDDPGTTTGEWRSTAREVLASTDEQARLIEALLTLASSERGLDGREPVDLATTVATALADLDPDICRRGIHIDQVARPASVEGDPLLVERLVANLLTNAVRHNSAGGWIEVVTGVHDGDAVVSVTNTGPLVPSAEVDRLFQPFQRLARRRANYKDGHGLGLSIVRAIANAHDATITAHSRPDGGLSVTVSFPQPASPPATPVTSGSLPAAASRP